MSYTNTLSKLHPQVRTNQDALDWCYLQATVATLTRTGEAKAWENQALRIGGEPSCTEGLEGLAWHIARGTPIHQNVYRVGSSGYYSVWRQARRWGVSLDDLDRELLSTDLGRIAEGDVPLDSPQRAPSGYDKKFIVYVKDKDGKVKKVGFGARGYRIQNGDDDKRKSFRARHKCQECNSAGGTCPKTSARYWSCNIHKYHKELGLVSDKPW